MTPAGMRAATVDVSTINLNESSVSERAAREHGNHVTVSPSRRVSNILGSASGRIRDDCRAA
jgi:hypothetical protein